MRQVPNTLILAICKHMRHLPVDHVNYLEGQGKKSQLPAAPAAHCTHAFWTSIPATPQPLTGPDVSAAPLAQVGARHRGLRREDGHRDSPGGGGLRLGAARDDVIANQALVADALVAQELCHALGTGDGGGLAACGAWGA